MKRIFEIGLALGARRGSPCLSQAVSPLLDRLIAKIKVDDERATEDPFELQLRALDAEGKLEAAAFKKLLAAYRKN